MAKLTTATRTAANEQAIFSLYMYLPGEILPTKGARFDAVIAEMRKACDNDSPRRWTRQNRRRLPIIEAALSAFPAVAAARVVTWSRDENGLNVCVFEQEDNTVSVVFRGTGRGEWIDSGEGLSGVSEENTFFTFSADGRVVSRTIVTQSYATDSQTEALNWFLQTAAVCGWDAATPLVVSGHSKGGNKAQFITLHSPLVSTCYSFDAPGFSPEAITAMKRTLRGQYRRGKRRILHLCGENDYVHALGNPIAGQTVYIETKGGLHPLETMLHDNGTLRPPSSQQPFSRYIASVSEKLMTLPPDVRQTATLGVMNILQTFLGRGIPVNEDHVSLPTTLKGIAVVIDTLLRHHFEE